MLRFLPLLAILFISFAGAKSQNWYGTGSDHPIEIQQELIYSSDEKTVIRFLVPGFHQNMVLTPQGKQGIISVQGMVPMLEAGAPDLPKYGVSAIIPDLARMDVRILKSAYTDFSEMDVVPSKGNFTRDIDPETVPYTYGEMYSFDAFYPDTRAELQQPFIFRDFRGQILTIYPFSYNPVSKTLRVYHELMVEIYNTGYGGENPFSRNSLPEKTDREFAQIYQRMFINYSQSRYPVLGEEGNMLIICHGPFMAAMQPFVEWKKTIGRPVEMVDVTTIGATPTQIKNYVANYYNTNGLTHLLLVGDHQQVPSHPVGSAFSDNTFGYILGNDSYNEVFVGRFSAETVAHVETQVQRTIEYERDIDETQTWLNKGMGIARNEGTGGGHNGGENDYVHMDFIRDSLLNYTYETVYREYDGNVPSTPNTNATIMSQRFNDGVSITNFCNHGSETGWSVGGYSISHVNALTNVGRLPFIWSVACLNGKFTSMTCFAEAWMRATHNTTGEPTGAIATMMSWISQPWVPPMTGQDEMVTILVEKRDHIKRTFGGLSINGSMKMIEQHGSSGQNTHDTWILFGDPSLMVRTDNPTLMTVSHLPAAFIGMSELTVNADAEDAIVAITMNGEILGSAYVNSGTANVTFEPLAETGTMTIAVFGWNRVTYLQDIDVIPPGGPYIVYVSSTIDDMAGGNGDGQIDYGESIVLGVELSNIGPDMAGNLNVTLTSNSPYITITNGVENFGDINGGASVIINDAFAFDVAGDVPDNTLIPFQLEMVSSDSRTIWTAAFNHVAHAPAFAFGNLTIDDSKGGNSNGRLDPGETTNIIVEVLNNGGSYSLPGTATLTSNSPGITINSGTFEMNPVLAGGQTSVSFSITVDPDAEPGISVALNVDVMAGSYGINHTFYQNVGLVLEDWESGNFASFPWTFGGSAPWVITSIGPYEGIYSARSGSITHNQTSDLIVELYVAEASTISFYRKVSSESGYDFLRFFIDGVHQAQWSGEVAWSQVSFPVSAGPRTFMWRYYKDGSVNTGSDCAWIDYIVFPAIVPPPGPPEIQLNPVSFELTMLADDLEVRNLTVSNIGEQSLIFTVSRNYILENRQAEQFAIKEPEPQEIAANQFIYEQALAERIAAENPIRRMPDQHALEEHRNNLCAPSFTYGCSSGDGFRDFAVEEIQNLGNDCHNNTGVTGWSTYYNLGPATLSAGQTYTFSMRTGYSNQYVNIWIDFNDDNILTADERILTNYIMASANTWYHVEIPIPESALPGLHKMRVMARWNSAFSDPCGAYTYGEAEDYHVMILSGFHDWLNIDPTLGEVNGQSETEVSLTFNTTGMEPGSYEAQVVVSCNDPVNPQLIIPVILHVVDEIVHEIEWACLQSPGSGVITAGDSFMAYGEVFMDNMTGGDDPVPGLQAWLGFSSTNTHPDLWADWMVAQHYGSQNDNDVYFSDLGSEITEACIYYYAYRFQYLDQEFVYGGFSDEGGGFWDNVNCISGVLTVNPEGPPSHTQIAGEADGCYHATELVELSGATVQNGMFADIRSGDAILAENSSLENGGMLWLTAVNTIFLQSDFSIAPGAGGHFLARIAVFDPCTQPIALTSSVETIQVDELPGKRQTELFFKVYPNPTTGRFALELTSTETNDNVIVEVYSSMGKRVFQDILLGAMQYEFDLSSMPRGIYFIRVLKGDKMGIEKVIKQ
jgi:hypothetical protein